MSFKRASNKTQKRLKPFVVNALHVAVLLLSYKYRFGYQEVDEQEYKITKARLPDSDVIGSAYLEERGIIFRFNKPFRDLLIEKGYPVVHPEEEVAECGVTDLDFMGVDIGITLGKCSSEVLETERILLIYREDENA